MKIMYNAEYFKNKKEELNKKVNVSKDTLIQDMFNLFNRFGEQQRDLQGRFDDLMKDEEGSKLQTELENKKKIDQAVKK